MRVLVIEDDPLLGDAIKAGLKQTGYAVDWMKDGESADQALKTDTYAAVVLDLSLPRLSGLDVLRRLRSRHTTTPVVILTARDMIEDKVQGLDSGADDYLIKPFDMRELEARLRALIRRSANKPLPTLQVAGVTIEPATRRVIYNSQTVILTAKEFAVLHILMLSAGRILSRSQIEEQLYAWGEESESNSIEVFIHHLRRKLFPELIENVRGVGYRIAMDKHD